MIWTFPDLGVLQLALTSQLVPGELAAQPISFAITPEGVVWLDVPGTLPRSAQAEWKRLGAQTTRRWTAPARQSARSWAEVLPLTPDRQLTERPVAAPVLFELTSAEQFTSVAREMLRLGNDRQSFRWLDSSESKQPHALLRVIGPPYYTLLRALDRTTADSPRAYLERAPRVWIEVGFTHPLVRGIHPPEGQLVLIRSPRDWIAIADVPFRDLHEVVDIPVEPALVVDCAPATRLTVRLSLRSRASVDPAEFWILESDPIAELNRLAQNTREYQLRQLAFAVGTVADRTVIALRIRPGRGGSPPALDGLQCEAYRPYPGLPNLYLPVGRSLHPPLRRDRVRALFAADPNRVAWLVPREEGVVPCSIPESVFRPLDEWVDYVVDQDQAAVTAWVQSMRFEFEAFRCVDDDAGRPRGTKVSPPPGRERVPAPVSEPPTPARAGGTRAAPPRIESPRTAPATPSEAQVRLREKETEFLAIEGPLDLEQRRAFWPILAEAYADAGELSEASICWLHALWSDPAPGTTAERWLRVEVLAARRQHAALRLPGEVWCAAWEQDSGDFPDAAFEQLLRRTDPTANDLQALTACLVHASGLESPPAPLLERLPTLLRFLEQHENQLPIRAAWLAWVHGLALAGGDPLALTRARDRLLDRLYQHGLHPPRDLPRVLRIEGSSDRSRLQASWTWLRELAERARAWSARLEQEQGTATTGTRRTGAYLDLLFAFGLARLGDRDGTQLLRQRAEGELRDADERHRLLLDGFIYRLDQILQGRPHGGPLPAEWLDRLVHLGDPLQRYPVDKMRSFSRVLEPDHSVEAYAQVASRSSELDRLLARLADIEDAAELRESMDAIWEHASQTSIELEQRAAALKAVLERIHVLGEGVSLPYLAQVLPVYDSLRTVYHQLVGRGDQRSRTRLASVNQFRIGLLERGLFLAAHYDQLELRAALVERFQQLLSDPEAGRNVEGFDASASAFFRRLRRMGMRQEVEMLLQALVESVLAGRPLASLTVAELAGQTPAVSKLLHVAAGWFYAGRSDAAETIMRLARGVLFPAEAPCSPIDRTRLACTYVEALAQAPADLARAELDALFDRLQGLHDTLTSGSHYSRLHLTVAEAVVLAVTSDEFGGGRARRWLDEDEFLIRQRVHHDVRHGQAQEH